MRTIRINTKDLSKNPWGHIDVWRKWPARRVTLLTLSTSANSKFLIQKVFTKYNLHLVVVVGSVLT